MNKRKLCIALGSGLIFLSVVSGAMASIAWFTVTNGFGVGITGSFVEEYFHTGDGTSANPFVITRPIHYYHLVEFFQRKTRLPGNQRFGTDYLYFQVGYDLDNDGDLEVYEYDNQGIYTGTADSPRYSSNLNMAYYSGTNSLMPIGTNEIPFIGSFDGKASEGIVISNLNICCSETVEIDGTPVIRTASDIGIFGYVADADGNSNPTVIKDSRFNGVTIDLSDVTTTVASSSTGVTHEDSHAGTAYVGYIAGHVHTYVNYQAAVPPASAINATPLHDVYVTDATIQGGAGVHCNYGYIGLVDIIDGDNATTTIADQISELDQNTGGTGHEWGGSIDMQSLYSDLSAIEKNNATWVDEHELLQTKYSDGTYSGQTNHVITENAFKNYRNGNDSYCFAKKIVESNTNDIIFLTGSRDKRLVVTDQSNQRKSVYFANGTTNSIFYIPNYSNANLLLGSTTAANFLPADGEWYYDGTTPDGTGTFNLGHVWTERNGVKYYLSVTPNQISSYYRARVSTSDNSYTWSWTSVNNNTGTQYDATYRVGYISTTHSGQTYSFYALNSMRPGTGTRTALLTYFKESYDTTITENSGVKDDMYDTCFSHSTGYIVSGSNYKGNVYPNGSGNIRVAQYPSSSITNASTILTYNASGNVTATSSMFGTYTETKEKFDAMVAKDTSSYYGLHFMNATIGDGYVTVPSSGKRMPKNCVEFTAAQKGSIKFFAGTYFGVGQADQNDAFFSLYKVNRSGNEVTSLSEIKYIYQKDGADYIYSDSSTAPSGYTLAFNTQWITNPTSITASRLYYFEIPVNAGEYALGSISGKNGAFLLYLDVGINGSEGQGEPTYNEENLIKDVPLFTQIDFQINDYVVNSCFNIAYVVPAGSTKETFSIMVSSRTVTPQGEHSYTCYDVVIVNSSGTDFILNALLIDDDNDPDNAYYYRYTIKYNSGERTEYLSSNTYTGASGGSSMTPTYSNSGS